MLVLFREKDEAKRGWDPQILLFSSLKIGYSMLAYEAQNHSQEIDLPSNEVPALPETSLTSLDHIALVEHLQITISEKERLLHTQPTFLYPKNGISGLL